MKKIAIITGASSGMGKEFALQISQTKPLDEIWLIARRKNNLEEIGNNVAEDDIDYALNDTKITKEDSNRKRNTIKLIPIIPAKKNHRKNHKNIQFIKKQMNIIFIRLFL